MTAITSTTSQTSSDPSGGHDLAVVGAGIVGLAVARELLRRRPGLRLVVIDKEPRVGAHQTGHNSGVVHQGVYYAPGSLKATLCRRGADLLYALCAEHAIPVERCGKVIVATNERELKRLDELHRRGLENGVPGLRRLTAAELRQVEPHADGIAALHSPETGIVDFGAVARVLAADLAVVTGCTVERFAETRDGVRVVHNRGETLAGFAVACAGLWSDRLAVASGQSGDPRIVPFRGNYHLLERPDLVRGLIYPVPDPALPFLGIHLTRRIDGNVLVGPSALLVGGLRWPGTWRVARRWWRVGVRELHAAASVRAFASEARRYVPELRRADLLPGPHGVRAQAVRRDGTLVDDFVFSQTERTLHVRNAPSPGATSSLAIAEHVVSRFAEP
jgi:2-hydroxyglutarate dehydrogenase